MTRSEPMQTLPLAEFLRLYNDSAYTQYDLLHRSILRCFGIFC